MDDIEMAMDTMPTTYLLLLMLLTTNRALLDSAEDHEHDEELPEFQMLSSIPESSALGMDSIFDAALNNFHLWSAGIYLEEDLVYWVKPRSTT